MKIFLLNRDSKEIMRVKIYKIRVSKISVYSILFCINLFVSRSFLCQLIDAIILNI